jgi:OOP family OmpA-OmpF porin
MSDERKILKNLLLQEELDLLEKLKHKVLSKDQFTQEVSDVLAAAIKQSNNRNNRINRALKEPINLGIEKAFKDNKQSIIDSILPIMGQLIRKTVTNSIKQFVADINRTLELGFSAKAIKWRWQAFRSGKSFAEMVFQKTVRYQIQEMFFVDRETGLLIEYAGSDELVINKDAISSMLTAIQDFIGDSLQQKKSELISAEIGDNLIIITAGPHAYLASVIKGSPTERLKERLQQLIELIHADFGDDFAHQENFRNLPELSSLLKDNLITKSIDESDKAKKINFIPWIISLVVLISVVAYKLNQRRLEFNYIQETAVSTAGLFVKNIERTPSGFLVNGLLDPLADLNQLQNLGVEFNTTSFISLDSEIILKRANSIMNEFPEVQISQVDNSFKLTGKVQINRLDQLKQRLQATPGIYEIIDETQVDMDSELELFFKHYSNTYEPIQFQLDQQNVYLQGVISYESFNQLTINFNEKFKNIKLNSENLVVPDGNQNLIEQINTTRIEMAKIESQAESKKLANLINSLHLLVQREVAFKLITIGNSDCNDAISDKKSQQRVDTIKRILVESELPVERMTFTINKCSSFDMKRDRSKRTVEFKVKQ